MINGSSFIDVDVVARYVQPGGESGTVGLDGDAVGFALVVKGVDRIPPTTVTTMATASQTSKMLVPQKTAVRRTKTEMDAWTMRMKTVCSIRWMRARTRMPAQRTTTQMVASMTRTATASLMMSTV